MDRRPRLLWSKGTDPCRTRSSKPQRPGPQTTRRLVPATEGNSIRRTLTPIAALVLSTTLLTGPAASPAVAGPSAPSLVGAGSARADAQQYSLGTYSFEAGALYVAFLKLAEKESPVDATPGLVGAGTDWIQIDDGRASAAGMGLTAYRFTTAAGLAGVSLQTDLLSSVHEGFSFSIVEVASGFDPAAPIAQHKASAGPASTGHTVSLRDAPAADSLVVASFAHAAAEESAPNAGWAEVTGSDLSHPFPAQSAHVIYDASEPGRSPGSTWTTAAARRGLAIEIGAVATPGVTLAAAGDICKESAPCTATSDRVAEFGPDFVMTLGDNVYNDGLLAEYLGRYGGGTTPQTRWGRPSIKDITLPGYGNHDCRDAGTKQGCEDAVTYFGRDRNFGTNIPGTEGSYWTVRGEWLIVQLNSAGETGTASAAEIASQNTALNNILAADDHTCELVAWHHARYSSGSDHGDNEFTDPWFETAHARGVDVILGAHDHDYERYDLQDGDGNPAPDGVRQFVAGTGGAPTLPFGAPKPNSQVRIQDWGILTMELWATYYSWAFLDGQTGAVEDSGTQGCHR